MVVSSTEVGKRGAFVEGVALYFQGRGCGQNGGGYAQRRASISVTAALVSAQKCERQFFAITPRFERSTILNSSSTPALKNLHIHLCRVHYIALQTQRIKFVGRNWAVGLLLFFAWLATSERVHCVHSSVHVSSAQSNTSVHCAKREGEETPDLLPPSMKTDTIHSKSAHFPRAGYPPKYSNRSLGAGESRRSTYGPTSPVRSSVLSNCSPAVAVRSFILDSTGSSGSASRLGSATPLPDRRSEIENAVMWNLKKDGNGWFAIEDLKIDHACIGVAVKRGHHADVYLRISAVEGAKLYLRSNIEYDKTLTALGDAVNTLQAQKAGTVVQGLPDIREDVEPYEARNDRPGHLHSAAANPAAPDDVRLQQPSRILSGARPEGARKVDNGSPPVNRRGSSRFNGQHAAEGGLFLDSSLQERIADQPSEEVTEPLHRAKGQEDDNANSRTVALEASLEDDAEKRPSARPKRRQDLAARVTGIQRTIGAPSSFASTHRSRGASSLQSSFRRHPSIILEPLPSGRYPLATQENPHPRVYPSRSSTRKRELPPSSEGVPAFSQYPFDLSTTHSVQASELFFPLWDGWEDSIVRMMAEIRTLDWTASDRMLQTVRLQVAAALGSDLAGSGAADKDLITTTRFPSGSSPRAGERRNDTRGRRLELFSEDINRSVASDKYPPFQTLHDSIKGSTAHGSSRAADGRMPRSQAVNQVHLYHEKDCCSPPVRKEKAQSTSRTASPGHAGGGPSAQRSPLTEAKTSPEGKERSQSEGNADPKGQEQGRDAGESNDLPFLKVVQQPLDDQNRSHQMVVVNIDALGRRLDAKSGKPLFYNDRVIVGWRCSNSELHTIRELGVASASSQTARMDPPAREGDPDSQNPASPSFCSRPDSHGKTVCGRVPPHLGLETRRAADQQERVFTEYHPAETPQRNGGTDECNAPFSKQPCGERHSRRGTPRRRLQVLSHMLDHFAAQGIDSVTPLFRRVPQKVQPQAEKIGPLTDSNFSEGSRSAVVQPYLQKENGEPSSAPRDALTAGEAYFTLRGSSPPRLGREHKAATTATSNLQSTPLKYSREPGDVKITATAHGGDENSFPARTADRLTLRTLVDPDELCGLDLIKLSLHASRRPATGTAETYRFRNDDVSALKAFIDKFASHDYVDDILFIAPDAPIRAAAGFPRRAPESRNAGGRLHERVQDSVLGAAEQPLSGDAADGLVSEPAGDDPSYMTDVPRPGSQDACGAVMARPTPDSEYGSAVACPVTRSLQATGLSAEMHSAELPNDPLFAVQWALGSSPTYEVVDSDTCFARARREMLRDTTEAPAYESFTTTAAHHVVTESQLAKIRRLCEAVGSRNLHGNEAAFSSHGRLQADRVRTTSEKQQDSNAEINRESAAFPLTRRQDVDLRDRQQDEMKLQRAAQTRESGGGHLGAEGGNNDNSIRMLQAWGLKLKEDQETNRSTVPVAVIDTGVNYAHPDLTDSMWINEKELNGIPGFDDDHNGYIDDVYGWNFLHDNNNPMDDNGHGTHVAGIIGAQRNNHKGVSGISSHARIIALKILDENGDGDVSHAIPAIRYALDNGARVITNSWGGIVGPGTHILGVLLREAVSDANGSVFVIASGNDGRDITKEPYYPASFLRDWTITVAAHTPDGVIPRWSNYGQRTVHLTAPGENITSTWLGSGYRLSSGTSMAAPMVSGVAAEVLAYRPHLQPQQVVDALIQSSTPDMKQKSASLTGARLNAVRALILSQMHFFSVSSSELHVGGEINPVGNVKIRMDTGMLPSGIYHGSLEIIYVRRIGSKHTSMLSSVFKRRLIQLVQISLPVTMTIL